MCSIKSWSALAPVAKRPEPPLLTWARFFANAAPQVRYHRAAPARHRRTREVDSPAPRPAPTIFAVDDVPELTLLYSTVLEAMGYRVRAFNSRTEALAALKFEGTAPELLITDYLNRSMPIEQFLRGCLEAHPRLRILLATGFEPFEVWFAGRVRWLRKPFTPDEFLDEVRDALAA